MSALVEVTGSRKLGGLLRKAKQDARRARNRADLYYEKAVRAISHEEMLGLKVDVSDWLEDRSRLAVIATQLPDNKEFIEAVRQFILFDELENRASAMANLYSKRLLGEAGIGEEIAGLTVIEGGQAKQTSQSLDGQWTCLMGGEGTTLLWSLLLTSRLDNPSRRSGRMMSEMQQLTLEQALELLRKIRQLKIGGGKNE
jgi:hypothetical protein